MPCPNCNTPDPGPGKFCIQCGFQLPQPQTPASQPVFQETGFQPPAPGSPQPTPAWTGAPVRPPVYPPPVNAVGPAPAASANVWGPFAGYGSRGRHVAWLLDNLGDRADDLRQAVTNRFQQRAIPGAQVSSRTLTAKGVLVEQRPYHLVQRGRATAGLYLAKFGQDLYISQVSYLKNPISNVRIIGLVATLAILFLFPLVLLGNASSLGDLGNIGAALLLLCCLAPFVPPAFLFLVLIVMSSIYNFVTNKDFLAPLRVDPNEFDVDDLIALEKAVEQTVREAMDVIGIDQALMPPAARYGLRERII